MIVNECFLCAGSITQASTVCLGNGPEGEVYVPLSSMLPMVDPDDIVIDGKIIISLPFWGFIFQQTNIV